MRLILTIWALFDGGVKTAGLRKRETYTIKSGIENIYKNKPPIYEILSGASIAFDALLLILPGFITDGIGFLLLIPFTRRLLINYFMRGKNNMNKKEDVIEAEVIEDKKDEL